MPELLRHIYLTKTQPPTEQILAQFAKTLALCFRVIFLGGEGPNHNQTYLNQPIPTTDEPATPNKMTMASRLVTPLRFLRQPVIAAAARGSARPISSTARRLEAIAAPASGGAPLVARKPVGALRGG